MDVILEGGLVVDGTGKPAVRADVAIVGDRIAGLGDLSSAEGRRISAKGKIVAPGFIDIHSHSDFTLLVNPHAESAVRQGVTTLVIGNCGHSCAPAPDPHLITSNIIGYSPDFGVDISWRSFGEYLDRLEQLRPAANIAAESEPVPVWDRASLCQWYPGFRAWQPYGVRPWSCSAIVCRGVIAAARAE